MLVAEPLGHATLIERLWRASTAGRLPHALLLEGPEGIGKFLAARWLAAGILCASGPGRPCGSCGPCKRVTSGGEGGNHPDLLVVDPLAEGEERIRVHRIAYRPDTPGVSDPEKSVEHFLELREMEGRGRVVIVRESHRMNASAQNALLKTLEEPRPGTHLVLETHQSELLLSTIKSRCVRIRCQPLAAEDCGRVLETEGLAKDRARVLARWAEGSPGRALSLAARGAEEHREHLAAVLTGASTPWSAARELSGIEGDFPGKSAGARARDRARLVLDLALAIVRDRMRMAEGVAAEELAHGDLAEALGADDGPRSLARTLERLLVARGDVERNLGPEAIVERALLVLGGGAPILDA